MKEIAFILLERPVTWGEAALGFAGAALFLLLLVVWSGWRAARRREIEDAAGAERAREMDDKVAEMNRLQSELQGRMQSMAEILSTRQGDLARLLAQAVHPVRHQPERLRRATTSAISSSIVTAPSQLSFCVTRWVMKPCRTLLRST